jgi:hypothetical protein
VKPASPNAKDDEFDTLSGWSTLGTLDVSNVSDYGSFLHLKRTASGQEVNGLYKAIPSIPFTATLRIPGILANSGMFGIMLLDSTPTAIFTSVNSFGSGFGAWNDVLTIQWSNRTTRGTTTDNNMSGSVNPIARYLRVKVNSSSSIDTSISTDGFFFTSVSTGVNSGLTVANVGVVIATVGAAAPDVVFDWIRFS